MKYAALNVALLMFALGFNAGCWVTQRAHGLPMLPDALAWLLAGTTAVHLVVCVLTWRLARKG